MRELRAGEGGGGEERRRRQRARAQSVVLPAELKCYFPVAVAWGWPPPACPRACGFWLVVSPCLFIPSLLLDTLL